MEYPIKVNYNRRVLRIALHRFMLKRLGVVTIPAIAFTGSLLLYLAASSAWNSGLSAILRVDISRCQPIH